MIHFIISFHALKFVFSLFLMILRPPTSTLFPYTTLFRSPRHRDGDAPRHAAADLEHGLARLDLIGGGVPRDRKSTRLNSSHSQSSYAVFCVKKKRDQGMARFWRPYRAEVRARPPSS